MNLIHLQNNYCILIKANENETLEKIQANLSDKTMPMFKKLQTTKI